MVRREATSSAAEARTTKASASRSPWHLAGTSAVLAQDVDFDPTSEPAFNRDEALILFHQLQERLVAMGLEEGQISSAVTCLAEEYGNLSEADLDELLAGSMLAESDAEMGGDEFGDAEGEEPEIGDEEDEE